MKLNDELLSRITGNAMELGVIIALIDTGFLSPYLKKNEAFRLFGRANIERWTRSSLIAVRKDGSNSAAWRLDRLEIETLIRAIAIEAAINSASSPGLQSHLSEE
ncbi:hypothetical protein [Mucilaginibacter phyllosphaerae]